MAYRDTVLADAPVEYWEFSETSGTTAASTGSSPHTASITGATITTGRVDRGRLFDGIDDIATVTSVFDFVAGTNYTVEAWFKWDDTSTDYPTIMRRDGNGKVFILRGRKGTLGDRPGAIEVYVNGRGLDTGSTKFNDGQWHHVVTTKAGTTIRLFVDNVEYTTGSGVFSAGGTGTTATYIGSNSGSTVEQFKGVIDEVAIYNTALSTTRIAAHYNGATVSAGYTAQAMTATAAMPEPTSGGNIRVVTVSEDTYTDSAAPSTNYATSTNLNASSTQSTYIKVPAPTLLPGEVIVDAKLILTRTSNIAHAGSTINVYRITQDWTAAAVTHSIAPTSTLVSTPSDADGGVGSTLTIDIDDVLSATNYGVRLTRNNAEMWASAEHATASYRPKVSYTVGTQASVSVSAAPMTATANLPESTVSATDTVSVGAQPLAASVSLVDASVSAETLTHVEVVAERMDAFAEAPDARFSIPAGAVAEAMSASAEVLEPSYGTTQGVVARAVPMAAVAAWIQPDLVNGEPIVMDEADDDYFQRVWAEFPKAWLRLNDRGSVAVDRMGNPSGTYHGVQTGRFNAPDNRHSVYFNGSASIEQAEPSGTNVDEALLYGNSFPQSTLEFSFKTTKTNTFLMVSKDASQSSTSQTPSPARELYLRDGKISYRTHYFPNSLGTQRAPYEFTGFKNLADGEWHTVVVKGLTETFGERGVEIWIDGKFEIRRTSASGAGELHGFPDWIGSRPSMVDGVDIGALPSSQNFEGEMSEVIFYSHLLTSDAIARHYYDFMAWKPFEAEPMEAFAFTPADHKGRGNQKRALALYFTEGNDGYTIGGDGYNGKMNFNPFVGFPETFAGYKMFYKSVDDNNGNPYRDPVTDAQTLINLEHDLDIDDYDVIMFKEWPDEGSETDSLEGYFPGALARLTEQLRWANDRGVGLFVTHPRLAVDLGIVDRVEFVPTLKESAFNGRQGNAFGNYDYGSAAKFPWNIAASAGMEGYQGEGSFFNGDPMNLSGSFLDNKAFFYADQNFNNRFRVRALIEGLTDIPSYMVSDAVYHTDYDPWGWQTTAYKYLHRYEGLQIGDEFLFAGTNIGGAEWGSWNYDNYRVGRPLGYYATPLANVKAGTVVTTFGATHWQGKSQTDNPYRNYATTIVLRPGDALKGKPVGGKIYVNFTEQPSRQSETVAVQQLPDSNADFPTNYKPDTPAQREWEWSDTRKSLRSTTVGPSGGFITILMPNGSTATIFASGEGGNGLTTARSNNLFPVEHKASWQMNRRGLWWLQERAEIEEGAVVVAAQPMTATVSQPKPAVVAQRDADTKAQPMAALAVITKVAEDTSGDADVYTLPLTAHAEFTGFSKVISAEPMTATAELVDNLEMVVTTGEQVVLFLHGVDTTLYLKEEV